jgi:hypothetical protein
VVGERGVILALASPPSLARSLINKQKKKKKKTACVEGRRHAHRRLRPGPFRRASAQADWGGVQCACPSRAPVQGRPGRGAGGGAGRTGARGGGGWWARWWWWRPRPPRPGARRRFCRAPPPRPRARLRPPGARLAGAGVPHRGRAHAAPADPGRRAGPCRRRRRGRARVGVGGGGGWGGRRPSWHRCRRCCRCATALYLRARPALVRPADGPAAWAAPEGASRPGGGPAAWGPRPERKRKGESRGGGPRPGPAAASCRSFGLARFSGGRAGVR